MTDVLSELPTLSFRGIEVPCTSIEGAFSHDAAQNKYVFRDEALIQSLGRKNITFRYEIPFRQGILKAPFKDLYLATFPEFLNACRDRTAGTLEDPVAGAFQAKVTQFSYTADPDMRDGVTVSAEFVHAPAESELDTSIAIIAPTLENATDLAGALDQEVAKVDWKQEPSPEPYTDPLSAVTGVSDQIGGIIDRTGAAFDNVAFKIDRMNDSLESLADIKNWSVWRGGKDLKNALGRTKDNLGGGARPIGIHFVQTDSGLADVRFATRNTVAELLKLNPRLGFEIPANTYVRYFKDK